MLLNPGSKVYIGSTVDGDGNEIKIYKRLDVETLSINQVAKRDGITTQEAYKKYGISVFRTTNAQTSIRTRIIDYRKENNIKEEYLSIEYIPKLEEIVVLYMSSFIREMCVICLYGLGIPQKLLVVNCIKRICRELIGI